MDRGASWATVHGVAKESDTTEQLKSGIRHQIHLKHIRENESHYIAFIFEYLIYEEIILEE